jgi:hypothetical protein
MRIYKISIISLHIVALLYMFVGCQNQEKEKVLEVAKKEALRIGYDIRNKDVTITDHPMSWDELFSTSEYYQNLAKSADLIPNYRKYIEEDKKKLEGKVFWIVSYSIKRGPGDVVVGGILNVFVNDSDGSILLSEIGM